MRFLKIGGDTTTDAIGDIDRTNDVDLEVIIIGKLYEQHGFKTFSETGREEDMVNAEKTYTTTDLGEVLLVAKREIVIPVTMSARDMDIWRSAYAVRPAQATQLMRPQYASDVQTQMLRNASARAEGSRKKIVAKNYNDIDRRTKLEKKEAQLKTNTMTIRTLEKRGYTNEQLAPYLLAQTQLQAQIAALRNAGGGKKTRTNGRRNTVKRKSRGYSRRYR
jgi:hypothetical protein